MSTEFPPAAEVSSLDPLRLGQQLITRYPEMSWMVTSDIQATPERSIASMSPTVGESLFPAVKKDHLIEFNRTYLSIADMHWVLAGDYASLTACQPNATKLSHGGFEWLRSHTLHILHDAESVRSMETFLAIHDIGKVDSIADNIRRLPDAPDTGDHDMILHHGLKHNPSISPSFAALSPAYQRRILDGMGTHFNLGQFVQGECVPASLAGLRGIDSTTKDFYLLHTLFDIAGAAGQFVQNGSMLLNEPMVKRYRYACESIGNMSQSVSLEQTYSDYLRRQATDLDVSIPAGQISSVILRLSAMLSLNKPQEMQNLLAAYHGLHPDTSAVLETEMDMASGKVVYYGPALLRTMQGNGASEPGLQGKYTTLGLEALARVYLTDRARDVVGIAGQASLRTIEIRDIVRAAVEDQESIVTSPMVCEGAQRVILEAS